MRKSRRAGRLLWWCPLVGRNAPARPLNPPGEGVGNARSRLPAGVLFFRSLAGANFFSLEEPDPETQEVWLPSPPRGP